MRVWTVMAAMVALASNGCFHSTGGRVGAALTGVGSVALFAYGLDCVNISTSDHNCESTGADVLGLGIAATVVGGLVLAIVSEQHYRPPAIPEPGVTPPPAPPANAPDDEPTDADMPALYEPIAARDPMARQLTLQAHRAAFRGQCAGVAATASRVRALDAEYYARVFAKDAAIERCHH